MQDSRELKTKVEHKPDTAMVEENEYLLDWRLFFLFFLLY